MNQTVTLAAAAAAEAVINIPGEWIRGARLVLAERAGVVPQTRADLELYHKAINACRTELMGTTGAVLFSIRGVAVRMELAQVISRGVLGDVMHLHGPVSLV